MLGRQVAQRIASGLMSDGVAIPGQGKALSASLQSVVDKIRGQTLKASPPATSSTGYVLPAAVQNLD